MVLDFQIKYEFTPMQSFCVNNYEILSNCKYLLPKVLILFNFLTALKTEPTYFLQQLLSQFTSPYTGHILGHHITGLCKKKQNEIAKAIKRAHCMGFMSVMHKDPVFRNDPKICNIKYPE
uniref:Uncharacterized protein n=1 Tax=Naja naja TaxID=35670 RepID=A0A8C6VSD4_NAJNA